MDHSLKNIWHFIAIWVLTISCISEDVNNSFTADELRQLLASDSAKVWNLSDRQPDALMECELDDQLIFWRNQTVEDSITLSFTHGTLLCPGQDSVRYQGDWDLLDALTADTLVVIIDGDTSKMAIDFITSQSLQLSYQLNGDLIEEAFSFMP